MFVGVCILSFFLLVGAANLGNDYLEAFACVLVLVLCAVALDVTGRNEAERHPLPIYNAARLPEVGRNAKNFARVVVLIALVVVVTAQAEPGKEASPLPYFVAAALIFFVVPQVLAWRAIHKSER